MIVRIDNSVIFDLILEVFSVLNVTRRRGISFASSVSLNCSVNCSLIRFTFGRVMHINDEIISNSCDAVFILFQN